MRSQFAAYSSAAKSSTDTPACRNTLRSVPRAIGRCIGTTTMRPSLPRMNMMRAGLVVGRKTKPPQCFYGIRSVNIRGQFHASASSGSARKCSRTRLGTGTPAARK